MDPCSQTLLDQNNNATVIYHIAVMFDTVYVWRIAKLKSVGKKVWQSFDHKDPNNKLKFCWLKFGKTWTIYQTFPLPNIPAIRYVMVIIWKSTGLGINDKTQSQSVSDCLLLLMVKGCNSYFSL